jgi:hypothetical protein
MKKLDTSHRMWESNLRVEREDESLDTRAKRL